MTRRGLEKLYGVVAIVVGIGVIVGVAAGVEFGPLVLILLNAVVAAWLVYYFAYRRRNRG